jgi:phage tail protein X
MPETYTVRKDHEMVDLILWRRYGASGQALAAETYGLNQNLAALGPVLPVGTVLLLPDKEDRARHNASTSVSLFD